MAIFRKMQNLNLTIFKILHQLIRAVNIFNRLIVNYSSLKLRNIQLRPNCLMTRGPLIFLDRPRTILSSTHRFEYSAQFIRAHGHLCETRFVYGRRPDLLSKQIKKILFNFPNANLICSDDFLREISLQILTQGVPKLNAVHHLSISDPIPSLATDELLDRITVIAESEWIQKFKESTKPDPSNQNHRLHDAYPTAPSQLIAQPEQRGKEPIAPHALDLEFAQLLDRD